LYSWYEANHFNIDIDEWKSTTLTYTVI